MEFKNADTGNLGNFFEKFSVMKTDKEDKDPRWPTGFVKRMLWVNCVLQGVFIT